MAQLEKLEKVHFLRFLKKNKILGIFMHNYYTSKYSEIQTKGEQIMSGFTWTETEQGGYFWSRICNQWRDEYRSLYAIYCNKKKRLKP